MIILYKTINLEKGMYQTYNKSFTEILEDLDPTINYKNTELEKLDAYQRQLKRFDIKVNGKNSDQVEKFFMNSQSSVLFPEFMARSVKKGIIDAWVLDNIISVKTMSLNLDYRPITLTNTIIPTAPINEGNEIPSLDIRTESNVVSLNKHGKVVTASYETLRFQNLEVFSVILGKIGRDIAKEELIEATTVLDDGADVINVTGVSDDSLTYDYLLQLWEAVSPYEMNVMLASSSTIHDILSLDEMKDATAGLDFHASGRLVTPLGSLLVRSESLPRGSIIGFDKKCALQLIQYGDINMDVNKIIDKQLDECALTITAAFNKLFDESVKKLVYA
ncbi:MAG: phage major capsid protein [Candidatus Improbicoccus pseudotrichonymphae]|uniref:Phage major capsid protein n=1 Tax=Candidatus Improbicoccus pseudotrichonymphae TaxID=3033792 RepID=A0AA48I8P8_9FIRM|nr:MAG: phage major capsid protein [Candidatus Improbicoccus pseudotrichonymphae]